MMMGGYFERSCIKYYLKQVPAEASRPALPTGEFKLIKKDQGFIQIERVETGLKIVLKCPKMEQIVVGMSNGSTTGFFLNKARTNILKVHRLVSGKDKLIWEHSGVRHTISLENEENFLVYSDQIYLWFLRAIDIEEPKEFTIEGVFDLDTVKLIKEAVKFYVSKMFERHLTPYKCKVSFSFTEIEEIVLKSEEVSS